MADLDLSDTFGEIAPRFGISRPAGRCFGAIWRAAQAPSAEDLVAQLGLSRSNVSVALKELREAGLIQSARSPGSRKDYFIAPPDPWELARLVLSERARRVFGPARDQLAALETRSADPRAAALCDVFDAVSGHLDALSKLSPDALAGQIDASRSAQKSGGKKKKKKG
ncbi:ArsR family transcriptional regulator [Thioclava dalianensis]|uniref:HTH-type transcriptional regulator n=1 Tax=Thioclava dalianensis TaxID=1185766 RepID=A0A074TCR7_9RHOB|nr:MarR family transcriptional regulator [Thioclava dalianensis]KEP69581.1 ArsR family transcriptional regulator [Thioclava dalianensis]SFN14915.1 MarR family protein [Thioclava dalianensis]